MIEELEEIPLTFVLSPEGRGDRRYGLPGGERRG